MSESRACSYVLPTIPIRRATSPPSELTSYVSGLSLFITAASSELRHRSTSNVPIQKIRTIELDGKTVKLQIVRQPRSQQSLTWLN